MRSSEGPGGERLDGIGIFQDLSEEDRGEVAGRMKLRRCERGELLFREGDPGNELYVVLSGSVAITVTPSTGGEIVLSRISSGAFFGEMCIIEQAPRSATCRAEESCELLALHADAFHDLIATRPRAAAAILRRMAAIVASRLGQTGSLLSQMVQWGEGARRRAVTDEATGLFNRRFYDESAQGILQRADLEGAPVALAMFDLDRFGTLNKTYGQVFCDRIIVDAAGVFKRVFGEKDILVRYGGDEFTFILPGRDGPSALDRCRAVNEGIRSLQFAEHPELKLTCSLGAAVYPTPAKSLAELQEKADKALYRAKEAGRDRTEIAEG
jgi:diguanylate cyclase (GGDEF)-like protein